MMPAAVLALALTSTAASDLALGCADARTWHREAVLWESAAQEALAQLEAERARRRVIEARCVACETAPPPAPEPARIGPMLGGAALGAGIAVGLGAGLGCEPGADACRIGGIALGVGLAIAGLAAVFF
jgi:hypothetical protein